MRNEIDPAATGRRIQEIRRQKGLRVTDISDYMGFLEPKAVYKWMRGDSLPTLQNMYQLSRLFGVTIDEIIQEAAGPEPRGRGQEKGAFAFGGSTILLMTQKGRVYPDQDLLEYSRRGIEVSVRQGEAVGRANQVLFFRTN